MILNTRYSNEQENESGENVKPREKERFFFI